MMKINFKQYNEMIDKVMEITGCNDDKGIEVVVAFMDMLNIQPSENSVDELLGNAIDAFGEPFEEHLNDLFGNIFGNSLDF